MTYTNGLSAPQSNAVVGLNSWTYTFKSAGPRYVKVTASDVPVTGLTITILKNGSAVSTVSVPSGSAPTLMAQAAFLAAASDILTVTMSSSTFNDTQPNSVKAIINIAETVQA